MGFGGNSVSIVKNKSQKRESLEKKRRDKDIQELKAIFDYWVVAPQAFSPIYEKKIPGYKRRRKKAAA